MQTLTIAFVCLLTAGGVARAADAPRPLGLPQLFTPPDNSPPAVAGAKPAAPLAAAKPHVPDIAAKPHASDSAAKPHSRICFNASDTREKIATHRLTEPFRALRAGRLQGEALRARLCRWKNDQFVYEISVLRRDGRIMHVYMNAENGQTVSALSDNDHK